MSTGQKGALIIERSPGQLSSEQIERARRDLQRLKIHPRETLPNTTALSRADVVGTHHVVDGVGVGAPGRKDERRDVGFDQRLTLGGPRRRFLSLLRNAHPRAPMYRRM